LPPRVAWDHDARMNGDLFVDHQSFYRVFRDEQGRLRIGVLAGSVAMYEVGVTLDDAELKELVASSKAYFDALARTILHEPHRHSLRDSLEKGFNQYTSLRYSDVHGMWGGMVVDVGGDGTLKVMAKGPGGPFRGDAEFSAQVTNDELRELAAILVEGRVWESVGTIPSRHPKGLPPDTKLATITLTLTNVPPFERVEAIPHGESTSFVTKLKTWCEERSRKYVFSASLNLEDPLGIRRRF